MKKILLILSVLLSLGFLAKAQLTYDTGKADYTSLADDNDYKKAKLAVINNTSGPLEVEWRIVNHSIPQDWEIQGGACDWQLCHGLADVSTHTPPAVPANTSDTIYVNMRRPNSASMGCSSVEIEYREKGASTWESIELRHTSMATFASCWALGVNNIEKSVVDVYPNPTNNVVNLDVQNQNVKTVQLSNLIGRQIQRLDISNSRGGVHQISLNALPKGIYILQFKNEAGKILGVTRITKR